MIEPIFAVIGACSILWFLYLWGQEVFYKRYYKGILEQISEVLSEVLESDKCTYSKKELSDILHLLHNRRTVSKAYFEEESNNDI